MTHGLGDTIAAHDLCSVRCGKAVWAEVLSQAAPPVRRAMRATRDPVRARHDGTVRLYFRLPDMEPLPPGLEDTRPRPAGMTCARCGAALPVEFAH